jgi:hypothetical protein
VESDRRILIDELGRLQGEKQIWAPKEKRLAELTEQIRGWYADLAPDRTELAIGNDYEIQVGEQTIEKSWISMSAVSKAVGGIRRLAAVALKTLTFKALAGVIGNTAAEALQVEAQTGHRKLKAVLRLKPAPVVESTEVVDTPLAA